MEKRKTNFTLEQVLDQLASGSHLQPSLLASELAIIAKETKDPEAVKMLCRLLRSRDRAVQYPAYEVLCTYLVNQPGAEAAVKEFEASPDNKEFLERFLSRNSAQPSAV